MSVNQLLKQEGVAVGDCVQLRGWVRTRRDSKAGLSFVQLHDGSCFEPAQVVAPGELDNYEDAIITTISLTQLAINHATAYFPEQQISESLTETFSVRIIAFLRSGLSRTASASPSLTPEGGR